MKTLVTCLAVLAATAAIAGAEAPSTGTRPMGKIIDVRSCGAISNDGKDDTPAVLAALALCRKEPASTLRFGPGRYDFLPDAAGAARPGGPRQYALNLHDLKGLTIDGQGATLSFHGTLGGLAIVKCQDVTVRSLTMDWRRAPFSTGRVVAVGAKTFDIEVLPEFPVAGGEPVKAFMNYDPKTSWPAKRCLDVYDGVTQTELLRPQVLRVYLAKASAVQAGMLMVLRHEVYGPGALTFRECANVRVEDVTVHTAPGMGINAMHVRDIALKGFRVVPAPKSPGIMTTTADATHFNACMGTIRIEDCVFQGMGDDAVNVHGMFHTVREMPDKDTVVTEVRNKWIIPPLPGHRLEFTDPATILPYATGTVRAVTTDAKAGTHRIQFAEPLPDALRVGHALGNVDWAPVLRITGCQVIGNRARGFLIQTRDALIENNTFRGCQAAGINITADCDYWTESIGTRKIVVRGNTFEDLNNGADWHGGAISIFADAKGKKPGAPGVHRDITIEGNTIRNTDGSAVWVGSADGVLIRGNTVSGCCRDPSKPNRTGAVYLSHSRNVRIEGNRLAAEGRSERMTAPVVTGPGCDAQSIVTEKNEGF